jgi:hypothetical protein
MKRSDAVMQRAMYLVSRPDFQADIKTLRKKVGLPEGGFNSEVDLENWKAVHVYDRLPEDDAEVIVDAAAADLVGNEKYELSPNWHHAVKRYAYLNDVSDMQLPVGIQSRVVYDDSGRPTIHVMVPEDATKADFYDEWERVEAWRKRLRLKPPKRLRRANKLQRGKFAYETWVEAQSYIKVAEELNANFADEDDFEDIYTADDAKTIVRDFKKQAGIYPPH